MAGEALTQIGTRGYRFAVTGSLLVLVLLIAACSSSGSEAAVSSAAAASPTQAASASATTAPQPTVGIPATAVDADTPATVIATEAPTQPAAPFFNDARAIGDVDDVTFVVTDESEATFTVGEQLVRLPLPNDAVMRTNALAGEVFLDGRPSSITIDIHRLSSDSSQRDNWVRTRMFPVNKTATFILDTAAPLLDGFSDGEASSFTIFGTLEINGISSPLEFEIEARDDGDVLFILGRTTFEWADIGMDVPSSRGTVSVEDEVQVEVLISARPLLES